MKIAFIGAGKVGFTLGKYFALNGLSVEGFFSRTLKSAEEASDFVGCSSYDSMELLVKNSDIIFVTTNDDTIINVWNDLKFFNLNGKIICHCSGSLSSEVFSEINNSGAYQYSIHPMYPFKDKYNSYHDLKNAFFSLEGHPDKRDFMTSLLESLGNKVITVSKESKSKYHLANVMVSNLVLSLLDIGVDTLASCGVDSTTAKEALMPLITSNMLNIASQSFENSITGPLLRGDITTLEKHIECIDKDQLRIYMDLSKNLLKISKNKDPTKDYRDVEKFLACDHAK